MCPLIFAIKGSDMATPELSEHVTHAHDRATGAAWWVRGLAARVSRRTRGEFILPKLGAVIDRRGSDALFRYTTARTALEV